MQKARRHPRRRLRHLVSTWFQVLFHSPNRGSFHLSLTVLVHYRSINVVFSLTPWSAQIHTGFTCPVLLRILLGSRSDFAYGAFTLYGGTFQKLLLSLSPTLGPTTPPGKSRRFGLFRFRSPLLTESIRFLFLRLLRCFTSPGIASQAYLFRRSDAVLPAGLPHSEISGSKRVCRSPKLIAAYHVLHRLVSPRHPPLFQLSYSPAKNNCELFLISNLKSQI
jgi:hypothetical protein